MKKLRLLLAVVIAILAAIAPALLPPPPLPPPSGAAVGANLPSVGRFSPESAWGEAGGLAAWALGGKIARVSALPWEAYPFGFDGPADFGYVARQMEVCRGTAGVLVLLSPSQFPIEDGEWIPAKRTWPGALAATRRLISEYQIQARRFGVPRLFYQLWNEATPRKPGGPKSGAPGAWDPRLHEFMAYLTKGLGLSGKERSQVVGPAISCLSDSRAESEGELASSVSTDGYWERRVSPAIHLRLPVRDGVPMTPEQYEAWVTELIDSKVDLVRSLPYYRRLNVDVWVTELYVTPGDLGLPHLGTAALGAYRAAALRGAARSKARAVLAYGIRPNEADGDNPWLRYGGWAPELAAFQSPLYALLRSISSAARPKYQVSPFGSAIAAGGRISGGSSSERGTRFTKSASLSAPKSSHRSAPSMRGSSMPPAGLTISSSTTRPRSTTSLEGPQTTARTVHVWIGRHRRHAGSPISKISSTR